MGLPGYEEERPGRGVSGTSGVGTTRGERQKLGYVEGLIYI